MAGKIKFHLWRANGLLSLGRAGERYQELQRALELDPLHPAVLNNLVTMTCNYGWAPVDEELFDRLSRYPEMEARTRSSCDAKNGALASAFRRFDTTDSNKVEGARNLTEIRVALKDCQTPLRFTADAGEDAFLHAVICDGDDAAISVYTGLSDSQQQDVLVQEFLAIVQLRQGKFAQFLSTVDKAYAGVQSATDLGRWLTSWSNMNLNRVLALQRVGNDEEATLLLSAERNALDQARRDGMKRGYHLLEAKFALLSGDEEAGLRALDIAFRDFEAASAERLDPVLNQLLGEAKVAEVTAWLNEHINAERAKLGWPPADF